jgi:hypothetical protein
MAPVVPQSTTLLSTSLGAAAVVYCAKVEVLLADHARMMYNVMRTAAA